MLDDGDRRDGHELNDVFPNLKPVNGPPPVGGWNGIGTVLYGRRDVHPETGTFVKTLFFTILFVPLFALSAYRCGEQSRRLFCLGKEPLSGLAKAWNILVILAILGGIGSWQYQDYIQSPEYRGRIALEQLEATQEVGDRAATLQQAKQLASRFPMYATQAITIADATVDAIVAETDIALLAAEVPLCLNLVEGQPIARTRQQLIDQVLPTVAAAPAEQAAVALGALAEWAPAPPDYSDEEDPYAEQRLSLLQRAWKHEPTNVDLAVTWAKHCEREGDTAACKAILQPLQADLENSEGARILGQIYAGEGEFDRAYELLWSYSEQRLKDYDHLSKRWEAELQAAWERALKRLRNGTASQSWYDRYDRVDEAQQDAMVHEWLSEQVQRDVHVNKLRNEMEEKSGIVGVAFDLGIVSLYRAQGLQGAEREAGFKKAEEAFLAIQGSMGENVSYQLYLAQVYMWMGRTGEGEQLFAQILKAERSPENLAMIANIKRELGDRQAARDLLQEAYELATDADVKKTMAGQRALVYTDLDDEIHWLKLSKEDADDPGLAFALGKQSYQKGDDEAARRHLQTAFDGYSNEPPTSSSLNNASLAAQSLFRITGRLDDYKKAADMQRRSLRLDPNHSIVVQNTVSVLLGLAVLEAVDDRLDYGRLRVTPSIDDLKYFYDDHVGRDGELGRLVANKHLQETKELLRRLQVLSPRNVGPYITLYGIESSLRDAKGMRELATRVGQADLELSQLEAETKAGWSDTDRSEDLAEMEAEVRRYAALPALPEGTASWAYQQARLVHGGLALHVLGKQQDLDALLAQAEATLATWPCAATRELVRDVLWAQAVERIIVSGAMPADFAKVEHLLDSSYIVGFTYDADVGVRRALDEDSNFSALLAAMQERVRRFPDEATSSYYLIVLHTDPKLAKTLHETLLADANRQAYLDVFSVTAKYNLNTLLTRYLDARLRNDADAASRIVKEAKSWGMPVPALGKQ